MTVHSPEDRAFLDGVLVAAGYVEQVLHDVETAHRLRAMRFVLLGDFRVCIAPDLTDASTGSGAAT